MKIARTSFVLTAALLLTISTFGYFFWYKPKFKAHAKPNALAYVVNTEDGKTENLLRLNQKALLAKDFIAGHGFNTRYCFLVDMHIASGKNRFFVYNLDKDSVEIAGLVTKRGPVNLVGTLDQKLTVGRKEERLPSAGDPFQRPQS